MTDISGEAVYLWNNRGKEGMRDEMHGCGVVGGAGGRNRRLLTRHTRSQTDTQRQAPLASACYNWQVVQAVKRLWVTTYCSNWIIYFCSKVLRWPHSLPRLNPLLVPPSFWCLCAFAHKRMLKLLNKKSDESGLHQWMVPQMIFFLNRSLCFFRPQGIAGKPGPRGQRGPTVGISTMHEPHTWMFYTVQVKKNNIKKNNFHLCTGVLSWQGGYERPTSANCTAHVIPPPFIHLYALLLQAEY